MERNTNTVRISDRFSCGKKKCSDGTFNDSEKGKCPFFQKVGKNYFCVQAVN